MTELLDAARDLRTVLDAEGAKAEAEGTPMTDEAVKLCREAGFYDTLIPKDVGGAELTFNESLDVFTELARADGSIGWVVMAGSTAACYFGSWSPASFSDVMFADGVPLVAGQFAPNGHRRSRPRRIPHHCSYSFGSGLQHAEWAGCGSFSAPAEGDPDFLLAVVPVEEADIIGNWNVMGLRSTASYDYTIDSIVPEDRTLSFFGFTKISRRTCLQPRRAVHHRSRPRRLGSRGYAPGHRRSNGSGQDETANDREVNPGRRSPFPVRPSRSREPLSRR